jgi:hypothetical protein
VWVLSPNRREARRIRTVSKADQTAAAKVEPIVPPWPLLFHADVAELAKRFDIRVSEHPHLANWEFTPRERGDLGGFQVMRVLLERTTHLPQAVQFQNRAGDVEMVFTFQYTHVQKQRALGHEPELLPVKPEWPKRGPAPTTLHGWP